MHSRKTWAPIHIVCLRRALPPAWGWQPSTARWATSEKAGPSLPSRRQPGVVVGKGVNPSHGYMLWAPRITWFTPPLFHVLHCPHQIYREDLPGEVVVASMQLLLQVGYRSLRNPQTVPSGYGHLHTPRHSVLQGTLNAKKGTTILSHALWRCEMCLLFQNPTDLVTAWLWFVLQARGCQFAQ